MTRLLITGASGNVGTALLRALPDDVEVIGVTRRRPPSTASGDSAPYDRVQWHAMDLGDSASTEALTDLMQGVDAVVHLVWGFQPTRDPDYLERIGVTGSAHVLAAADAAGVPHLVHISSVGAYAPKVDDIPVTEDYPHTGMPTSTYSVHKSTAERHLDDYERAHPGGMTITRVRPGIVFQRDAGAAFSRYGVPAYLPARLLRLLPLLPLDKRFAVPVVHADDLATALVRIVERKAGGAFNIAAPAPMTRADVAAVLGAHPLQVPAPVLHAVVQLSWKAHLQPIDAGWIDLAFAVPLQDSSRAARELDWATTVSPRDALAQAVDGITGNSGTSSPVLRPRSAVDRLKKLVTSGPVSTRRLP